MPEQKGDERLWEQGDNSPFSGAAPSPEADFQFRRGMGSCISLFQPPPLHAHKHMEVAIGRALHHGRQTLPHFQLLPNHHVALSLALSFPLVPVS